MRSSSNRFSALAALVALAAVVATHSIHLATAQDGQQTLVPGAAGDASNVPYIGGNAPGDPPNTGPVRLANRTGHVSNYNEANVKAYTLPDPLVTFDGKPVTTAEMWTTVRRPEILKFYEEQIYGRVPDNAPKVTWEVASTDETSREGAIIKQIVGHVGDGENGPQISVTLTTPTAVSGNTPVLLEITFGGGGGGRRGGRVGGARGAAGGGRLGGARAGGARGGLGGQRGGASRGGPGGGFNSVSEVLNAGWSYATVGYGDIQPDQANRWTDGVIGLTLAEGQTQPAPDEWGTISAWSWGLSRIVDYLETDPAIDSEHISIAGTSRLGKTVLWAAAQDQRIASVMSIVGGEMGAALIRRDWGETLDDMAQNYGWQFAGNLQNWVGKWNELPIDQHLLVALSAPRPVYVNGGLTDQWSDPKGEFLSMAAAGPVYELLGGKGMGVTEVPPLDQPVISGDLGFHYHSGGHQAVPADWTAYLQFAKRHFETTSGATAAGAE